MHFCSKLLIKEPKERGKAPAMIIFCAFQQIETLVKYAKKHGFNNYYPLIFIKHSSSQVLKANMKIVGATEYALVFYRDKLPKFNNNGKMIKNWFEQKPDSKAIYPKVHPTQKPVNLLKTLIRIFTDPGDTVIDPVAGSGSTLRAAKELKRNSYGFEVEKEFYKKATTEMLKEEKVKQLNLFQEEFMKTEEQIREMEEILHREVDLLMRQGKTFENPEVQNLHTSLGLIYIILDKEKGVIG